LALERGLLTDVRNPFKEADAGAVQTKLRSTRRLGIKPDRLNFEEVDMAICEQDQITKSEITTALADYRIWDLGNEILYRLCADHPQHSEHRMIIAKMWLIGRAYSAAVERRRVKNGPLGDEFYTKCLARTVGNSKIDTWFRELREDRSRSKELTLRVHKRLVDLLKPITGLEKRSFASKYLHFHFPDRFFLYDARAEESVRRYIGKAREDKQPGAYVDRDYADFFARCEDARHMMAKRIGRENLTPREVDDVLPSLWSKHHAGQRPESFGSGC
jgi:hypothetical protein